MPLKYILILIILFLRWNVLAQSQPSTELSGSLESDRQLNMQNLNPSVNAVSTGLTPSSSRIQPMAPTLQAGATYNANNLPQNGTTDLWFKIPNWRSGEFHREIQTDFTLAGPKTFKSAVNHFYGFQTDKIGQIWNYVSYPYTEKVINQNYTDIKLVIFFEVLKITNELYSIHCITNDIIVNNSNNQIVKSYQTEDFQAFKQVANNVAEAHCHSQFFDSHGQAISESQKYLFQETRIKDYKPTNFWNGKDLSISFANFLLANHLNNLIP